MEENLLEIISNSELFKGITHQEIEDVLLSKSYRIGTYHKNDVFALARDKVNYLMIVLKGSLTARMVSNSGKYVQIDKITEGRVIAPAMIFASDNAFPVNVIPEDEVRVFFMHKDTFLKAMQDNEKLLFNFIRIVSDINRFLSQKIHSLSLRTIRGKLAEYILQLSETQENTQTVIFSLTRQELADKFAVARQALSRSLSELEEDGLIQVRAKSITIIDKMRLADEE